MKKIFSKITSMLMVICLMFGIVAFSSGHAFAEDESWVLDMTDSVWVGETGWAWVYNENSEGLDNATITNITSSNTAVVGCVKDEWYDENDEVNYEYSIKGKSAGKATVTIDYTTPGGKTGTLTKEITVKKYPNQIKSLKVNGKKVKVSKNKFAYSKKVSKSKATVNIKMALKKGWKIEYIGATKWSNSGKSSSVKVTKKMLSKGSSIKFPKKYTELWITVTMKKGSNYIDYSFFFYR